MRNFRQGMCRILLVAILLFAFTAVFELPVFSQVDVPEKGTDTSRFFPDPGDLDVPGWQMTFQNLNQETRNFLSSSNRGYRMLVDMNSSPKTAITINCTITLVRPGSVIDEKRGVQVPGVSLIYQQFYNASSVGHYMPAERAKYGDESFEAAKDYDKYRIFIRRGQYLVDVVGTDVMPTRTDKPPIKDVVHYFANFIDSRIFGARIGIFRPVQVLNEPGVPMVAGKRMVIYTTVEMESETPGPPPYLMVVNVGQRGFRQLSYQLPLQVKIKTEFTDAGTTADGSLWAKEYAEPVQLTPENRAFFGINENPKYTTYLYRFFLDPEKPGFYSDYVFNVHLEDTSGSRLFDHIYKMPTKPSGKMRVAVMPLPVGFWAPGKDWKADQWNWISKLKDQAWKRESYISFVSSLPESERGRFTRKPLADFLRKHLPASKGKRRYEEKVKEAREFLMGCFPLAEENFEIYVYEEFPEDLKIDPHSDDLKKMTKALDEWHEKHPRFDRVIGVVPGGDAMHGGVMFFLDNDMGLQFWFRKKSCIVSVDAPAFQFAHDLAQTYGAIDEFLPEGSKPPNYEIVPINRAAGVESGIMVTDGYWPAKQKFMGTPLKPVNSIMGIREPAWIPKDVYNGIMKQLAPE